MMPRLTEHFTSEEFACHCGCGADHVLPSLIDALEDLRLAVGERPIKIISGVRCVAHNSKVGGTCNSMHLIGRAADIRVADYSLADLYRSATTVREIFHGGIGIYPLENFLHVDTRQRRARWGYLGGEYCDFADAWAVVKAGQELPL